MKDRGARIWPAPGYVNNFGNDCADGEKPEDRSLLRRGSAHYHTLDPQPIEVIQAWGMAFDAGNAVKYIARVHSGVNGLDKNVEDLGKAIHYLELWRDRLQRESSSPSSESSSG